jgi:hypothetical protein
MFQYWRGRRGAGMLAQFRLTHSLFSRTVRDAETVREAIPRCCYPI